MRATVPPVLKRDLVSSFNGRSASDLVAVTSNAEGRLQFNLLIPSEVR